MNRHSHYRFEAIDALRGIAALFVVWHHSSETFVKQLGVAKHGTLLADAARELDFGRIGIICFFLISGFVIPSSLKQTDKSGIKHFTIRRLFRLYPAYWLSIIFVVIVANINHNPVNSLTIVANSTMLQGLFQEPHLIGLYWTLQVELLFYFLCAILFYFRVLHNDKFVFYLLILFFTIFVLLQILPLITGHPLSLHNEIQLLPYLLSIMFLGSLYRKINDDKSNDTRLKRYVMFSTALCLGLPVSLLIIYLFGFEFIAGSFRFGTGHSLGFLLFFAGVYLLKNTPKPLLWLGTISYSLYLFHPIVMKIFVNTLNRYNIFQGHHLAIYMMVTTIISILLAYTVYTFIEKPAINIGYKLTKQD